MLTRREAFCTAAALAAGTQAAVAQEKAAKKSDVDAMVDKGLTWLAKNQSVNGNWEAPGGQYPGAMTGLAGTALLMEGSTLREGKYSDQLLKAVKWFLNQAQPNGLLVRPTESSYTYAHGFGMLFLSSVYGEEEDADQRKKLEAVLTKGVDFCGKAQSSRGGWYYTSRQDGGDADEGSTTITQLQGLRAAKNAGIKVPKEIIDKAVKYLRDCTTSRGGVIYSLSSGGAAAVGQERPALTAAAVACSFSAGQYKDEFAKKWIKFCKENIPFGQGRIGHDEYQTYYFAQAMYVLGEERYGEMFPNEPKASWLTWSKFRATMVEWLKGRQQADGSFTVGGAWGIGPVFCTSTALTILQLEKGILPIYHR